MVASPLKLTTIAVLIACFIVNVHTASIESDPITEIDVGAPLDENHPATGRTISKDAVEVVVEEPNGTVTVVEESPRASFTETIASASQPEAIARKRTRNLEAVQNDVAKLEQYFGQSLEKNFDAIRANYNKASYSPTPWASSYWPTYKDGINDRWAGSNILSPAEKYATAFNKNVGQFTDNVSKDTGIWSTNRPSCNGDGDCSYLNDQSRCAKRRGEGTGRCIPSWWGICHAWAPASIHEPEPQCSAWKNGIEFKVFDIKALITQVYDGARIPTVFTGMRFNGPNTPETKDQYGRYTDIARRDLGPAYFHLAVTNIMGRFKKGFIVDVESALSVWNQPVRGYDIQESYIVSNTAATSQQYFGTSSYPFNSAMQKLAYVRMVFYYIDEAYVDGPLVSTGAIDAHTKSRTYTYLLELDSSNTIIGGEWVGNSRYNHPDFLWIPTKRVEINTVTSIGLVYSEVRELLDLSINNCGSSGGDCGTIQTNTDYIGNDIGSAQSASVSGCCSICKSRSGCGAYSWTNYNGGTCWLKSSKGATASASGVSSGTISGGGSTDQCSAVQTNVDYIGNDIGSAPSGTVGGCCSICKGRSGCGAYTWSGYNGGTCWLKSSKGATSSASGLSSGTVGTSSSSCSAIEYNVDYIGNDIGSAASGSVSGCCNICKGRSGCGAFSWTNYNGGTCWLKSSKGATKSSTGVNSAYLS